MHQVDRMEKQLQSLTDSAMSYKSIYAKSAHQMAREAMEVKTFPLFFVILPSSLKNLGLFVLPSDCNLFFTFSKFLKLLICLLFNHFFDQACEQEAASSKKVSFPITQRWP